MSVYTENAPDLQRLKLTLTKYDSFQLLYTSKKNPVPRNKLKKL